MSRRLRDALFLLLASGCSIGGFAAEPIQPARQLPLGDAEISSTFSIVAVDPENRICGAAVASRYPAVGKVM
jgi:hypothetical protein